MLIFSFMYEACMAVLTYPASVKAKRQSNEDKIWHFSQLGLKKYVRRQLQHYVFHFVDTAVLSHVYASSTSGQQKSRMKNELSL